ncbi:uncharacterized protein LOC135209880 [Macrobrachium nipponense]|uniref:uncharacterized protein LOC135209880 n=1 Tax=Macrobrachium nipponense TaxID=159736 RepID=UPI0030C8CD60
MNPLGRHLWSNGETKILTSCGEGNFTCTKFECIDLNLHCNAEYDCTDNSDEVCDIVKPLNQSYNRNQPSEHNMPVELTVFTKLVHDIDVSKGLVCVWLQLETIWQDSRLEFVQLRDDMTDNKISNSSHIWEPRYTLSNGLFDT